eukprot:jgi/Tetstr1/448629/TSEL_035874.t1
MGVQSLWQLLEPVGRRVNIETLTHKRLAVDASIWLVQFIKAMRDERGEVVRNAHLLGFFRRICRLLFHKVRPVFVFDGATPALKKRTTAARRRRREQQNVKVRRTAERLLVSRLKQTALGQAAAAAAARHRPGSMGPPAPRAPTAALLRGGDAAREEDLEEEEIVFTEVAAPSRVDKGKGKAAAAVELSPVLAHSAPTCRGVAGPSTSAPGAASRTEEGATEADALLAAQLEAEWEAEAAPDGAEHEDVGGEGVGREAAATAQALGINTAVQGGPADGQRQLIELADLPKKDGFEGGADSGGTGGNGSDSDSGDEADIISQLALPSDVTEIDVSVLSTLPPSVQFDIMQKLREEQFNQNRLKFQDVATDATAFSRAQMAAYLKASAFRRKLDRIRAPDKADSKKLANESGREYVYHCDPEVAADAPGAQQASDPAQATAPPPSGAEEAFWRLGQDAARGEGEEEEDNDLLDDEIDQAAVDIPTSRPAHWRERAQQRQRFWSRAQGFKFGRKLGDWRQGDGEAEEGGEEDGGAGEDGQLQLAIQASLEDAQRGEGAPGDSDGIEWEDAGEDVASTRMQVSSAPVAPASAAQGGSQSSDGIEWEDAAEEVQAGPGAAGGVKGREGAAGSAPGASTQTAPRAGSAALAAPNQSQPVLFHTANLEPAKMPPPHEQHAVGKGDAAPGASGVARHQERPTAAVSFETAKVESKAAVKPETEEMGDDVGPDPVLDRSLRERTTPKADEQVTGADATCVETVTGGSMKISTDLPKDDVGGEVGAEGAPSARRAATILTAETEGGLASAADGEDASAGAALHRAAQPPPQHAQPPQLPGVSSAADTGQAPPVQPVAAPVLRLEESTGAAASSPGQEGHTFEQPSGPPPDLGAMLDDLEAEEAELRSEARRYARNADTPTAEMYSECQELLQMFGLPYIIAPMEAEAQCAWLNANGLVDGVVTDDNDAFLFGAREVYRNIFDGKKYVEQYKVDDLETELGLTQERLIALALLLGCDYTEGVPGIGVVNAVEVIMAFLPPENQPPQKGQGWQAFKEWVEAPDVKMVKDLQAKLKRRSARKKGSSAEDAAEEEAAGAEDTEGEEAEDGEGEPAALREFKAKHRNIRKTWQLPEVFPNPAVLEAFRNPSVDHAKDRFTFGRPDIAMLHQFCSNKFGWLPDKANELLSPVVKAFDERETQLRVDQFFAYSQRFAKIKSTRLQKAVRGTARAPNPHLELKDDELSASPSPAAKGKRKAPAARSTKAATASKTPASKGKKPAAGGKEEVATDNGAGPGALRDRAAAPGGGRQRASTRQTAAAAAAAAGAIVADADAHASANASANAEAGADASAGASADAALARRDVSDEGVPVELPPSPVPLAQEDTPAPLPLASLPPAPQGVRRSGPAPSGQAPVRQQVDPLAGASARPATEETATLAEAPPRPVPAVALPPAPKRRRRGGR